MPSYVTPKINTEYIFYVSLVSQADTKLLQNSPTMAAGDVKVSTDGAAEANITTLPVVTPASSDALKVTLSAAEMNGDNVRVTFSDAAGAEWCDLTVNIQTSARQVDDLALASVATEARLAELDAANLPADIADIPTVAEFNARTLVAASYFDPAADTVANVTTVATLTGHTAQTGDSFARLGAPAGATFAADIADLPTVAEFNARTLVAASYFDPAADTVANVTTVATLTGHTAQTGDNFARLGAPAGVSVSADIADVPTVSEFNARTLVAASYFDPAADTVATVTTLTGHTAQTGDNFARLGAPAGASVSADIAAVQADLPAKVAKNVALSNFQFVMIDSTDDVTPKTGETITAQRSIDGGALAACANSATELSNGIYQIDLAATDLNGDVITLRFSSTNANDRLVTIVTQPT